jgi:hypothetical protein
MDLKLGLKSRALREEVLRGVVGIINIHICVVAANTAGEVLGTLSSFLAALSSHSHVYSMKDLIAKFLWSIRQFIGESSESFDVGNYFRITILDGLDYESTHAIHNGSCRA